MTCIFFGHRNAVEKIIKPTLKMVLVNLIEKENADMFYVGNHGNFDFTVKKVLKELQEVYPIKYYVVLAYISEKNEYTDYSDTIYPDELNIVPHRYRIIERNKWMLNKADTVITYVTNTIGGAAEFKAIAETKGKRIINLSL